MINSVTMPAVTKALVAALIASLTLPPVAEPKLVAKYALAHVDATSWAGAQIRAFDGSV